MLTLEPEIKIPTLMTVSVDGSIVTMKHRRAFVDLIHRSGHALPQVCYHPQLGPIQTCDTCMVEVDGELVGACGTKVENGTTSHRIAPREATRLAAMDGILGNHELYCTVCDNNNRTVPSTTRPR